VREAVTNVAKLALLDVLLDRVERLLLGDLYPRQIRKCSDGIWVAKGTVSTHLHLGVGPARHLNNHVQDGLALVGVERDVVKGRDGLAILLDEDAVLEGVGSSDSACSVGVCGVGVVALLGDGKRGHGD